MALTPSRGRQRLCRIHAIDAPSSLLSAAIAMASTATRRDATRLDGRDRCGNWMRMGPFWFNTMVYYVDI